MIGGLDIDGIRVDKGTQMNIDFVTSSLIPGLRKCAKQYNKNNFFVPGIIFCLKLGEITTGISYGKLYTGRGNRTVSAVPGAGGNLARDAFSNRTNVFGFDSAAFHYSIYRAFLSTAGLKGELLAPFDVDSDLILDWGILVDQIDYFNANTGAFDPR